MWTRKLCIVGGQARPDDWLVLCLGFECGRVYLAASANPNLTTVWRWYAWSNPAAAGLSSTLEDGCNRVRQAVRSAEGKMGGMLRDVPL